MSFWERRLHWLGAGLVFVVTQIVYLKTMTITVPFWDSGEFIATSKILGIPHPPGTPLYVLIGRVFAMLAPFAQVATRVNWLSALASSLGAAFTYLVAAELWERGRGTWTSGSFAQARAEGGQSESTVEHASLDSRLVAVAAGLVAGFFTAFSRTYWDNSIEAEVYSLCSFITALSFWLILRWARFDRERAVKNGLFVLLYYLICLSMGISLMAVLVLPGILLFALLVDYRSFGSTPVRAFFLAGVILLLHPGMLPTLGLTIYVPLFVLMLLAIAFYRKKWPMVSGRGILTWCLIVAVIGVSTHFYLTIRALWHNPAINEADPQTWSALWKVLTRDQYKPPNPFLIRKAPWAVQFTRHFWDYARDQFSLGLKPAWMGWYVPYLLGLVGAIGHWRREKKGFALVFTTLLIMSVGLVFYLNFAAEEVRDRDYFFVEFYHFFAVWIGLGAAVVLEWVRRGVREPAGAPDDAEPASGRRRRLGPAFRTVAGMTVVLSLLPFMTMKHFWFTHDRHGFYVARDFAYNMLEPLKPNAILFTNGDNDTFPLWYLQEVEGIRKDVRVANLSLLNTDWYIHQLRDQKPKIDVGWTDSQISQLEPYLDPKTNQPVYVKDMAVAQIISREYGKRPIYVAVTVPELMGLENRLVMEGLVFELKEPATGPGSDERIDADLTLHNLRDVYMYRGLLKPDGTFDNTVYKDENASRLIQNYAAGYLRAAEEKADQGDQKAAMDAIDAASRISPDSRAVRYSVGILLMRTGKYAEAEEYFQKLIDQGWNDARLLRMLGRAQEAQKKLDAAEQSYRRAVDAGPNDFEAMRDLFSYLWQVVGDRQQAIDVLQQWARRHPDDKEIAAAIREYSDSLSLQGSVRR